MCLKSHSQCQYEVKEKREGSLRDKENREEELKNKMENITEGER